MRLDSASSAHIVNEMLRVLGETLTIEILDVSHTRLNSLAVEGACLTRAQLESISSRTGTSWPRWAVEGSAHLAKTAKAKAAVEKARKMWDEIDGRTMPWPTSLSQRRAKAVMLRRAI